MFHGPSGHLAHVPLSQSRTVHQHPPCPWATAQRFFRCEKPAILLLWLTDLNDVSHQEAKEKDGKISTLVIDVILGVFLLRKFEK